MNCDPSAGLYPALVGNGCSLRVHLDATAAWQEPLALFAVIVIVLLAALVIGQMRRGG